MPVLGDCEVFDVASDAVSDTFRDANGLFGMTVDIVRHLPIGPNRWAKPDDAPVLAAMRWRCTGAAASTAGRTPETARGA